MVPVEAPCAVWFWSADASRRTLEMHFRKAFGHSIGEEIPEGYAVSVWCTVYDPNVGPTQGQQYQPDGSGQVYFDVPPGYVVYCDWFNIPPGGGSVTVYKWDCAPGTEYGREYPPAAKGIAVNSRVGRLHVLHATQAGVGRGTPVARYVLHYADGSQAAWEVVHGEDVDGYLFAEATRLDNPAAKKPEPAAKPHA